MCNLDECLCHTCSALHVAAGLLNCNTAWLKLATAQDAKVALFYQCKYITKNPAELIESISILVNCKRLAVKYGSSAEDAGRWLVVGVVRVRGVNV